MQPIPKWIFWLGGALVWVAGVGFALFALAAPARAELAFTFEAARVACAGAAPEKLRWHANTIYLPTGAQRQSCRMEVDFAASEPALATRAAEAGVVEFVGLKLVRATYPERLAVNRDGIAVTSRPGGLTLSIALETLFGANRQRGAALILSARTGDGDAAESHLSPTLIIERAEPPPALLRAKRTQE